MVALKYVLLASLATLTVASPTSSQGGKPNATATSVARQGGPSGTASGAGSGDHERGGGQHGNGQHSGKGGADDYKHKKPNGNRNGAEQHQPRAWSKHGRTPPSGNAGSQNQDDGQYFGKGGPDDNTHKNTNDNHDGGDKHGQHHPRDAVFGGAPAGNSLHGMAGGAPTNAGAGFPDHDGSQQGGHVHGGDAPGKDGDDGKHWRRQTRDASSSVDVPDEDPLLERLRQWAQSNGTHEGDPSWDEAKHLRARGDVYGIYECMHHNFVAPCKWTEIKTESTCYNAIYDNMGSMGPDEGMCCEVWEMPNCDDKWTHVHGFHWPGIKDYGTSHLLAWDGINDEGIRSARCKFNVAEKDCKS